MSEPWVQNCFSRRLSRRFDTDRPPRGPLVYDYEWALRSRYYQYLSELLQLHHNNPEGQRATAYARYRQRQEARAAALLNTDVDVGSSLGRLLVLQATTLMGGFFGDIVE